MLRVGRIRPPVLGFLPSRRGQHSASRLPRVAQKEFWLALVPSFFRRATTPQQAATRARVRDAAAVERRTGLIFLFLGILVGSNAINIIATRRDMLNFTRQADAKLALLREIVQKVKNGQDLDLNVSKALGVAEHDQEKAWEQLIEELESTDMLAEGRKRRHAQPAQKVSQDHQLSEAPEAPSSKGAQGDRARNPKFLM